MAYHVTKDLKAEIKVGGSLFLKDLMGLILFPAIMYFLTGAIVADGLKIVYIVYNVVVVLALLQRPKSNPGKQVWQIFLLIMKEDEQTNGQNLTGRTEHEKSKKNDCRNGKSIRDSAI